MKIVSCLIVASMGLLLCCGLGGCLGAGDSPVVVSVAGGPVGSVRHPFFAYNVAYDVRPQGDRLVLEGVVENTLSEALEDFCLELVVKDLAGRVLERSSTGDFSLPCEGRHRFSFTAPRLDDRMVLCFRCVYGYYEKQGDQRLLVHERGYFQDRIDFGLENLGFEIPMNPVDSQTKQYIEGSVGD